jgi:hypothetical protein
MPYGIYPVPKRRSSNADARKGPRGRRDVGSIETPAPDAARSAPGGGGNGNRFPRFERHARPENRVA